jgi:hypothetical protein
MSAPALLQVMFVLLTDVPCIFVFALLTQLCQVLSSGYIGTSPASIADNSAKSLSTGMYTFYQV